MWALVSNDLSEVLKRRAVIDPTTSITSAPANGKPFWVPIVEEVTDTSTGPDKVTSPWVETIEAARVLRARSIRDKAPAEIDAEDAAAVDKALLRTDLTRALLEWVFDAENRVRILEGDPTITLAQFKTAIKNRIRS